MRDSRIFVLTDISSEEPDDLQSLIRLLLYTNEIEIEGLVATLSEWKSITGSAFRPDLIYKAIDAYEQVLSNLRLHDPNYPAAESLRSTVAVGNGNDLESTGQATPGAALLADAMLRRDTRPLWVTIWGGAATLAQAVQMLAEKLSAGELHAALARTWVYEIQGQDDCGAWLAVHYPQLNFIRSQYQWRGISNRVDGVWPETKRYLDEYVEPRWFDRNIREGHGPLGDLYPHARFLFEGDTPSLLHLIPNGLHDPVKISQGGWGGRFINQRTLNVWSGGCPVNNEARFGEFSMFTDAADALYVAGNGKHAQSIYNPIRRWRDAYQLDFAARMDWCVRKPQESNHAPIVRIDADAGRNILTRSLHRGDTLVLDASDSRDPDARALSFHWWVYTEAGERNASMTLENPNSATLHARASGEPGECHLILEVTNAGDPPLRSYRRVIVQIV